jgi:hypothetical protein
MKLARTPMPLVFPARPNESAGRNWATASLSIIVIALCFEVYDAHQVAVEVIKRGELMTLSIQI